MVGSILVVGAGLTGSVIARQLADLGYKVDVFESRSHVAGNCYTETDAESGIMLHKYGPHIFHTNDQEVFDYLQRFGELLPYCHKVKAKAHGTVYSLPINLHTINQFFNKALSPNEAKKFISDLALAPSRPVISFEDQALRFLGPELYEAFLKGYTEKQWGCSPDSLPASILKRLPVRFNYNDSYFDHIYQCIPRDGYTELVKNILNHGKIKLHLNRDCLPEDMYGFDHIFYSGSIDSFFGFKLGRLAYRTLDFEEVRQSGDFQGCAVMNYPDPTVPHTRITEHKHFSPWLNFNDTVCFIEYSRNCTPVDIPYYPIRLVKEKRILKDYVELAQSTKGVTFVGRLGTYRYLDMDVCVREALDVSRTFDSLFRSGEAIPSFFCDPL